MIERRRFLRIKEDDAISYSLIPNYKTMRKLTRDLSLGGIRFICDQFISQGSILKLKIELQHTHRVINAVARLVWIKTIYDDESYETGAQFIEINKEDLEFLKYHLSKPRSDG